VQCLALQLVEHLPMLTTEIDELASAATWIWISISRSESGCTAEDSAKATVALKPTPGYAPIPE
jgi:hypothetical protein